MEGALKENAIAIQGGLEMIAPLRHAQIIVVVMEFAQNIQILIVVAIKISMELIARCVNARRTVQGMEHVYKLIIKVSVDVITDSQEMIAPQKHVKKTAMTMDLVLKENAIVKKVLVEKPVLNDHVKKTAIIMESVLMVDVYAMMDTME